MLFPVRALLASSLTFAATAAGFDFRALVGLAANDKQQIYDHDYRVFCAKLAQDYKATP